MKKAYNQPTNNYISMLVAIEYATLVINGMNQAEMDRYILEKFGPDYIKFFTKK